MSVDVQAVKRRVTLVQLLERDGVVMKRVSGKLVCYCPFHQEKTPSCRIHEKPDGDWYKCFGCDAKGDIFNYWANTRGLSLQVDFSRIVSDLAAIGGLTEGAMPTASTVPKRTTIEPEEAAAAVLDADEMRQWERACAELYTDREQCEKIAAWRGYRVEVVEWAARQGKIGRLTNRGGWREAFLIERAGRKVTAEKDECVLEPLGWHVRLAPRSRANDSDKASWRYEPRTGLSAWPFVILPAGGIAAARYLFCLEGQWDALALVDLMGWEAAWPESVAVFGMRGATSWKRIFDYALRPDAAAFLISDRDEAGAGWFVAKGGGISFSGTMGKTVRAVYGFWPAEWTGTKDLNDVLKVLSEEGRGRLRSQLRAKIQKREAKPKRGPTFYMWLKAQKAREDEVGEFAVWALKMAGVPHGRVRQSEWGRFLHRSMAPDAMKLGFRKAWEEWGS